MLFQQLVNRMCSHCLFPACWQLATRLLSSTDLLQVVPTTCYRSAIQQYICQQVVSDNLVATWWNNSIVTTCWQACYTPVANTSCWQACYKHVANTSCWQVVRFLRALVPSIMLQFTWKAFKQMNIIRIVLFDLHLPWNCLKIWLILSFPDRSDAKSICNN
jgi:hypothetical protein